jgi:hypothetical protein
VLNKSEEPIVRTEPLSVLTSDIAPIREHLKCAEGVSDPKGGVHATVY